VATAQDVLQGEAWGLSITEGDQIAPAGLYASDKDLFGFMVNQSRGIKVPGGNELYRGFFLENSEVGDRSLRLTTFLYNRVCGNHIVWDAHDVKELKVVHRGNAEERALNGYLAQVREYADASAYEAEQGIAKAVAFKIGDTAEEVLDALWGKRIQNLAKSDITGAIAESEAHPEDRGAADPLSAWGIAQGLTRLSQKSPFADARVTLDRAASKVLQMAF
jgi:hypothetical protein